MKNAWWWVVVVLVIVIAGVLWWYMQSIPNPTPAPAATQPTTSATTSAVVSPAAGISARDNSDTSLGADLNDVNSQLTQLNAEAQAAQ